MGVVYAQHLLQHCVRFDAFCDTDPAKHGKTLLGVPIVSPEKLPERYPDANVALTVSERFTDEIASKLGGLGVLPGRIFPSPSRSLYPRYRIPGYSVDMFRDTYDLRELFPGRESQSLFRLRYRHWVLGDRPENPGTASREGREGIVFYESPEIVRDVFEQWEDTRIFGDVAVEFSNDDACLPPRIFAATAFYFPTRRFRLRFGSAADKTVFYACEEKETHAS